MWQSHCVQGHSSSAWSTGHQLQTCGADLCRLNSHAKRLSQFPTLPNIVDTVSSHKHPTIHYLKATDETRWQQHSRTSMRDLICSNLHPSDAVSEQLEPQILPRRWACTKPQRDKSCFKGSRTQRSKNSLRSALQSWGDFNGRRWQSHFQDFAFRFPELWKVWRRRSFFNQGVLYFGLGDAVCACEQCRSYGHK